MTKENDNQPGNTNPLDKFPSINDPRIGQRIGDIKKTIAPESPQPQAEEPPQQEPDSTI